MADLSNTQRALWTFLFYTLVGPFIAALILVLLVPVAGLAGLTSEWEGLDLTGFLALMGQVGLFTYVWAAPPAGLAALGLLPFVFRSGTFGWISAVVAGVLAFAVAAVLFSLPSPGLITHLAFVAGIVSLACWWILNGIGLLAR